MDPEGWPRAVVVRVLYMRSHLGMGTLMMMMIY